MGSETTKFPIIDFSDKELKPGTPSWDSLKVQVQEALEEYGCFEASFNKVSLQLRKSFLHALKELFDLPPQTKMKYISKTPGYGYAQNQAFECMGIEGANISEMVESFIQNMWPEGNPNLSEIIQVYSEQLSELDQMVRRMALESLGIEQYMDDHFKSTHYLARVMKYKPPQTNVSKVASIHTDKNCVTILHADEVPGLEIETKDGQWIPFKFSPESFIVILGESLHGWTNGRLYAPHHRVMMAGNNPRYSLGLFSIPNSGHKFEVPKELVDEEHPLLFKPFVYSEFLAFAITNGLNTKDALRAYCGA